MDKNYVQANLVVRSYESRDLEGCRELWLELTQWHRDIYHSPNIGGENPGLFFDKHLDQVGSDHIWVAELDGKVIGLTGLLLEDGEGELEPLVVTEEYRSQGIGRQLVEIVIEQARKVGVTQLKVRPVGRNEEAIQFFHQLGFNIIGHIELFQEFKPEAQQIWQERETITNRKFKV
jgi:N-acetylglutamate synthase-like GNAT family acetyltransferase